MDHTFANFRRTIVKNIAQLLGRGMYIVTMLLVHMKHADIICMIQALPKQDKVNLSFCQLRQVRQGTIQHALVHTSIWRSRS